MEYTFSLQNEKAVKITSDPGSILIVPLNSAIMKVTGDRITVKTPLQTFSIPLDEFGQINGEDPAGDLEGVLDQLSDMFNTEGGGGGAGLFLDPLFFGGTGTEEDPIVPLGFRGSDNLAYTFDGENMVILLFTPAAPTNLIIDDEDKTAAWTPNPDYPTPGAHEYSVNGGASWQTCTANPQPVGNIDVPAGQFKLRIAAVEDVSNASDALVSEDPFIAVLQDLDAWTSYEGANFHNSGNNISFSGGPYAGGRANLKFAAGAVGFVMADVDTPLSKGHLGLDEDDDTPSPNGTHFRVNYVPSQGKIYGAINGDGIPVFQDYGPTVKIRLMLDGDTVHMQCSSDGGETWVTMNTSAQPNVPLIVKCYCEEVDAVLNNIQGIGLVAF